MTSFPRREGRDKNTAFPFSPALRIIYTRYSEGKEVNDTHRVI
nr:MAG TPA: hypothetical protein [Caudoviricetes sp.]